MTVLLAEQRLSLIESELNVQGACRTRELAQKFGTSEMTIRRDLAELEQRGLARRVHGGAVLLNADSSYIDRSLQASREKTLIGVRAVRLLQPGQTVYLDTGTTAMELARALRGRQAELPRLLVVTHAVNIATELAAQGGWRVHVIGGEIYQSTFGTASPDALKLISRLNFDVFFLGACGVHTEKGLTNTNVVEATVKREVLARSRTTYLLADHRKWGALALAPITPFADLNGWISDAGLPDNARRAAKEAGVKVMIAD